MKKLLIFLLLLSQIVNAQNKVTLTGGTGTGGGMSGPVSVTTGNGFAGSVLNSTTTPAITLSTTVNGIAEGNGTSFSALKIGFDFTKTTDTLKFANVANVRYFGAVGDGTTNNSAAFTAAIATGLPVYVPAGTFLLSTTVTLQTNQILYGSGWNSIIKITANTRAIGVDSGSQVRDLKFVGNGKAGSGAFNAGVFLNAAVGGSVQNCMFQDFSGDPVLNGGGGIFASSIHTANSDGWRIINNYFYNNDAGLNLATRGEYVTVTSNTFGGNTVSILAAAGNLTINSNIIQNNTYGVKSILATNGAHSTVNNNLLNHNTYPIWLEDATFDLGFTFSNNMVYYGALYLKNCANIKFSNNHFSLLDSVHLDNATFISRIGGWWGLNQSNAQIPVIKTNGAEDFTIIGETRHNAATPGHAFRLIQTDTAELGPAPLYSTLPADVGNKSVRYNTSTRRFSYADTTTGGAGGANTALSNLASVLVNTDLDPGSNNSRDIGDGTTSWKDIYAYSFNVRNGSGSGLHTSYTNYSGTPSNGLPPSTGFFVNRVSTGEASNATPTPTGDGLTNFYQLTALATNATFQTPSGSVIGEHNLLWIIIEDNGTTRTLAFNGSYVAGSDLPLPTATVAGESMELQFRCHGGTIWRLVGRTGGF